MRLDCRAVDLERTPDAFRQNTQAECQATSGRMVQPSGPIPCRKAVCVSPRSSKSRPGPKQHETMVKNCGCVCVSDLPGISRGHGSALLRTAHGRMQHAFACIRENFFERFAGNAFDVRFDEPSKTGGNSCRQRNRFGLHISASITFDKPPVSACPTSSRRPGLRERKIHWACHGS